MSSRYLLDTCVVSELVKPRPEAKVIAWLEGTEADHAFLSAVTIGEIQLGISQRPPSNRRTELEVWLNESLLKPFASRILALDADTFIIWGQMVAQQRRQGRTMGIMDSLIAALSRQHHMILVTRNVADFGSTGLSLLNPWE